MMVLLALVVLAAAIAAAEGGTPAPAPAPAPPAAAPACAAAGCCCACCGLLRGGGASQRSDIGQVPSSSPEAAPPAPNGGLKISLTPPAAAPSPCALPPAPPTPSPPSLQGPTGHWSTSSAPPAASAACAMSRAIRASILRCTLAFSSPPFLTEPSRLAPPVAATRPMSCLCGRPAPVACTASCSRSEARVLRVPCWEGSIKRVATPAGKPEVAGSIPAAPGCCCWLAAADTLARVSASSAAAGSWPEAGPVADPPLGGMAGGARGEGPDPAPASPPPATAPVAAPVQLTGAAATWPDAASADRAVVPPCREGPAEGVL
mmetsp:Transcript_397/g.1036  ORF Transcript_397/g.1036 Transcript_397/m.1036 type:complete len:319 (+) Transcript_397:280-1236(+)